MAIVLENVSYVYSPNSPFEKVGIKNVSLRIEKGEFIAVIGHTGSGKTTLTQVFNGLNLPSKNCGSVFIDGELMTKKNASKLRKKIGYVFQYPEHQLFEETVYKDIAFGLKRFKLTDEEENKKIHDTADLVGLKEELLERSIYELSGGEKRRAAICGVLVSDPDYIVFDEPAAGLDPQGKNYILNLMKKMNDAGKTIIFISHSMDDVCEYAKRVIVINGAELVMDGNVHEVFSRREELISYDLDLPEINKLFIRLNEKYPYVNPDVFTHDEALKEIERLKTDGRLNL